jgi:hypothetical protein
LWPGPALADQPSLAAETTRFDELRLDAQEDPVEGTIVRVLALDIDDLLEVARHLVTRSLTEEESRAFLHIEACPTP